MKQLLFSLILIFFISSAYAELTNINEVTDLFDKNIENKDQLLHEVKTQNDSAIDNIKSGTGTNSIEGINEAESTASELKAIEETDLENKGREKRASKEYQFYDENELEPNYNKSGNKLHKLDAEDIVNATEESMRKLGKNFLDKLRAVGVDCYTVKGPIHKEPTYYIEVKRENQNNTDYDQFFCEELRNKYDCRDELDLTCKQKGMKWKPWENRTITMVFYEIPSHWWIQGRYTDSTYHGSNGHGIDMPSQTINPACNQEIASHIASKIDVQPEQIQVGNQDIVLTNMAAPYSRNADLSNCASLGVMGAFYDTGNAIITFTYQFRTGDEICEEWVEDWNERCNLK